MSPASEIFAIKIIKCRGRCRTYQYLYLPSIKPSYWAERERPPWRKSTRPSVPSRNYSASAIFTRTRVDYVRVSLLFPWGKKSRKFRSTCLGNRCHLFMRSGRNTTRRLGCERYIENVTGTDTNRGISGRQHVEMPIIVFRVKWLKHRMS